MGTQHYSVQDIVLEISKQVQVLQDEIETLQERLVAVEGENRIFRQQFEAKQGSIQEQVLTPFISRRPDPYGML